MASDYNYKKRNYDQILFRVRKGKADEYRAAAQDMGIGFWELIQNGVEEYITNHGGEIINRPPKKKPAPKIETVTATERQLLNAFAKCPDHLKPTLKKLIEQIAGNEH